MPYPETAPEVFSGLGLPPPTDYGANLPPPPGAPAPIHPAVLQSLGFPAPTDYGVNLPAPPEPEQLQPPAAYAPPLPQEPAQPAPAITQPPAAERAPIDLAPTGRGDYAIAAPEPAPVAVNPRQAPVRAAPPVTPEAKLAQAAERQRIADEAAADAIASKTEVDAAKSAEEYQRYKDAEVQRNALQAEQTKAREEFAKVRGEKAAFLAARQKEADSYKVDQGKYWRELGAGDQVGWTIAMALAGIGQAISRQSGPNPVIAMFQQKINSTIQQQLDAREQLRDKVGGAQKELDRYDQLGASREAQFLARSADVDKRLAQSLLTTAAKYGTPQAIANGQAEAAKLMQSSAEKYEKAAEHAASYDNQRRQTAISAGNLQVAQKNSAEQERHDRAMEALQQQSKDLEALKLERAGKSEEAKLVRERSLGGVPVVKRDANGKPVMGPDGKPVIEYTEVKNKDGSIFIPKGEPSVLADIQKKHASYLRLEGILRDIIDLGPEWMSDTRNSAKLQEMKQALADARLEVIAFKGMGAPTGHDIEHAENFIGMAQAGQWKDAIPGLKKAIKSLNRDHSRTLEAAGLDHEWSLPDFDQPAAKPTKEQELETTLRLKPETNPEKARNAAITDALKAKQDIGAARLAGEEAAQAARDGRPGKAQVQAIDTLARQAIVGTPEEQQAAEASLRNVLADRERDIADESKAGVGTWLARTVGGAQKKDLYNADPMRKLILQALADIETARGTSSAGPVRDPGAVDTVQLVNRFAPGAAQYGTDYGGQ